MSWNTHIRSHFIRGFQNFSHLSVLFSVFCHSHRPTLYYLLIIFLEIRSLFHWKYIYLKGDFLVPDLEVPMLTGCRLKSYVNNCTLVGKDIFLKIKSTSFGKQLHLSSKTSRIQLLTLSTLKNIALSPYRKASAFGCSSKISCIMNREAVTTGYMLGTTLPGFRSCNPSVPMTKAEWETLRP